MCGKDCTCGGRRKKKSEQKSSYSSKIVVDWTKPIYATEFPVTAVSRTLPAKYHGKTFEGEAIVEIAKGQYCGPISADNKTPAGYWIIENTPEPKPEKWINVYWNCLSQNVEKGIRHTSEVLAKNKIRHYARRRYLGTFKIEE